MLQAHDVRKGSFTTDAFTTRADQCPLLLQQRHYFSVQRSDAMGQKATSRLFSLTSLAPTF
jgi:hypothetical protein